MHKVTTPRKDKNTARGVVPAVGTGHQPHRGGAGRHAHRATKRSRTRGDQRRQSLAGW